MIIDTHVHCRGEEQSHKETIEHALSVARDSGVSAIFDMPNPQRPVFNLQRAEERLEIAKRANVNEVFYGTFLGLTSNIEQTKLAIDAWRKLFPRVVGFKLYAGHSTGNLGVVKKEEQAIVYQTLSDYGFDGVLFVHAEKEGEMNDNIGIKFDSRNPISHCMARPPKAEYESVKDQIELAMKYGFKGKLHIAHVSHISTVALINQAKKTGLDLSCGVCPHHFIFDYETMQGEGGILLKMNPPLREPGIPGQMLIALKEGKIDWVETDHAPHSLEEKVGNPFFSGIPGLARWPIFLEYLRAHDFSEKQIADVTYNNAAKRFGINVNKNRREVKNRSAEYPTDVYGRLTFN